MFRVSLKSRTHIPEKTLYELAWEIQLLTRQTYPNATVSLRESLAKDQFIEALADPKLCGKVHQAMAATLTEVLDAAVEVEVFLSAEKHKVTKQRYSHPRVLGQWMQLLGKKYTSSKQWSNAWPSILKVHLIPHPMVGRGPELHQSVGCVVPRNTFNNTALNALKIGFVHH